MPRTSQGGRHELGQNFLNDRPTIEFLVDLAARASGPILEIGAGDGALTRSLQARGHRVTAIDLDHRRVAQLRRSLPGVRVEHADALRYPLTLPTVVGNIPFHLTTPILRRLLTAGTWQYAVLLTQWEVARKRAGVGGGTMMTAQAAPWFEFGLQRRVPARCFTPMPSVDGGILTIHRRVSPLIQAGDRAAYDRFIRSMYTGRGGSLSRILQRAAGINPSSARRLISGARIAPGCLPRDLDAQQWATLWNGVRR